MDLKSLNLNEDCFVCGEVTDSRVSKPQIIDGRNAPIYSVSIRATDELTQSLGLLYWSSLGPNVANLEEITQDLMNAKELTFESIHQPNVSGQNLDTGEFDYGTKVKVSCRFEARPGEVNADDTGCFMHPRLVLRFVDSDWKEEVSTNPLPETDPEVMAHYDF